MALPNTTPDDNTINGGSIQEVTVNGKSMSRAQADFLKGRMNLFDTRLYRKLVMYNERSLGDEMFEQTFYPHFNYGSYVMDYYETPTSIEQTLDETDKNDPARKALEARKKYVENFIKDNELEYLAARSLIHPYALVKLAGSYGNANTAKKFLTYDQFDKRKFYEIDGDATYAGQYSKTPTTSTLIKWGNESPRGKTPYCFQDFVFCKWWNKIENNRMITLRRYAAPVTDNIEFSDYNVSKEASGTGGNTTVDASTQRMSGSNSNNPWTPLATAVTFFGEGTDNKLSDILSFSAKYNWKELEAEKDPINISSYQNDAGNGLVSDSFNGVSSGLGDIAKFMGFMGEVSGKNVINLEGAVDQIPPDPYKNGPYMNRILGPINVITNTYRRERGLVFTHDSLKITFDYVSRPIAGINNKAVLLDLMSNILILTYSSGSWFGGMWRYNTDKPAIYPWKYGDSMNKLYRGEIFGKNGAVMSLTKHVFSDGKSYLATFLPDAAKFISNLFKAAADAFMGAIKGDSNQLTQSGKEFDEALWTGTGKAIQKVIAAKAMKGTTIPYIKDQRALLTGDPVGDWHLTIGNPLNPIAMIGNLIVKNVSFKWYDELGPDDFPIGFKATVELAHGLGRDRDAIESMFNRGFGRIYTLPKEFRSSADGETKVDENTGGVNTKDGRTRYDETRNTYFGGGTRFIARTQHSNLANAGVIYTGYTNDMEFLKPTSAMKNSQSIASYYVNPWQMAMNM